MVRPLALAWRFLLVVSLALNPLVGMRAAVAAVDVQAAAMPCSQMSAGDMAGNPMTATAMPAQNASGTMACGAGSGCKMPGCDFAACCGPCLVSLHGCVGSLAHVPPDVRLPGVVVRAMAAPDIESPIRPPIA